MTNESEVINVEQKHFDALEAASTWLVSQRHAGAFREASDLLRTLPDLQARVAAAENILRRYPEGWAEYRVKGLQEPNYIDVFNGNAEALPGDANPPKWLEDGKETALAASPQAPATPSPEYTAGKKDGWDACEVAHGIVDGVAQTQAPAPAVPVDLDDLCSICGETYGQHCGDLCPQNRAVSRFKAAAAAKPAAPDNFEPVLSDGGDLIKSFSNGGGEFWQDRDGENYYRIPADYLVECLQAIERAALLKVKAPVVGLNDEPKSACTDCFAIKGSPHGCGKKGLAGIEPAVAGSGE